MLSALSIQAASLRTPRSHSDMERPSTEKRRSTSEATPPSERESSASMVDATTRLAGFAAETDIAETGPWPPAPLARRAPLVTELLDMPPEMLMEIVQRIEDGRALAAGNER